MSNMGLRLYQSECLLLVWINSHYNRAGLNRFFRWITHLGGAQLTISIAALTWLWPGQPWPNTGMQSALALLGSFIPVHFLKRLTRRLRPYLQLPGTQVVGSPLVDHSFPSGHTTAIFAIVTPWVLEVPWLGLILYPLALCVGVSRMYLGLHYPSDVLAGMVLGSLGGYLSYTLLI